MKEHKTEFHLFTILEYDKEAEYLRNMHKKGWKLGSVAFPGFYRFDRCEPEDVVYQLDYNREKDADKDNYVQMFRDCGWEYLFDYVQYSYFRKRAAEMENEEGIFCDEESRRDMLQRIFRGRIIYLLLIFFCVLLPVSFTFATEEDRLAAVFCGGCLLAYIALLIHCGWRFLQLRKSRKG